jgi:hypothetical protein
VYSSGKNDRFPAQKRLMNGENESNHNINAIRLAVQ